MEKIASAANCIPEYAGQVALLAGNERQRGQRRDHLDWLLKQKEGELYVDVSGGRRHDRQAAELVGWLRHWTQGRGPRPSRRPPGPSASPTAAPCAGRWRRRRDERRGEGRRERRRRRGQPPGCRERRRHAREGLSPEPLKKPRGVRRPRGRPLFGDDRDDREKARRMITDKFATTRHGGGGGGGGGGRKRGGDDSGDRPGRPAIASAPFRGGQRRRFDPRDRGGGCRDRDRSRDRGRRSRRRRQG